MSNIITSVIWHFLRIEGRVACVSLLSGWICHLFDVCKWPSALAPTKTQHFMEPFALCACLMSLDTHKRYNFLIAFICSRVHRDICDATRINWCREIARLRFICNEDVRMWDALSERGWLHAELRRRRWTIIVRARTVYMKANEIRTNFRWWRWWHIEYPHVDASTLRASDSAVYVFAHVGQQCKVFCVQHVVV